MSAARAGAASSALSNGTPTSQNDGILAVAGGLDTNHSPLATSEVYGFAWVKTDAADYPPGTTVNITGGGFQPGEAVQLTLVEDPDLDNDSPIPLTATADDYGNFSNSEFQTNAADLNIKITLTAVGAVSQAQTTFTDANVGSVTVAAQSPISAFAGNTLTYNPVTVNFAGQSGTCTATLSVSGLPSGASSGGFSPSSVSGLKGGSATSTLTVNTTAAIASGSYPFTVAATQGSTCDSPGHAANGGGTLAISAPPTFTSTDNATFAVGVAGSFLATASGFPTPTYSESGVLPNGMAWSSSSHTLSGTPTAGTTGTYPIIFTAANGILPDATQNFTLTIKSQAAISSVVAPADGYYRASQNLDFTVNYSEKVTVSTTGGTPYINLTIGSNTRRASYVSGSGTSALAFRYLVASRATAPRG